MAGVSPETIREEVRKLRGVVPNSVVEELEEALLKRAKQKAITSEALQKVIEATREAYLASL
ncbi:MAG: hypothetical protein NQU48_01830, partial [Hadesarchaea archaeon]|nr:hypothetical protein [Hadesarchaea archaeon]